MTTNNAEQEVKNTIVPTSVAPANTGAEDSSPGEAAIAASEGEGGVCVAVLETDGDDDDDESRKRKLPALKETETLPTDPGLLLPVDGGGGGGKRARAAPTRVPWEDRVALLKAYKAEHGHLNIPIRYKNNPSLGKFVHNTREQYKLYHNKCKPGYQKRCSLTAERIAELDDIGFLWTTERVKRQNDDWATRLEQLKEYKAKHGDCLVPHGYAIDPSFAEWIHRQRTTYATMLKENKPNPMVQSRMAKLEEMGFNFTVHTDKWIDHWKLLKEYKDKYGDCQVPTHYAENPKLGRWTHTQRHQRRLQKRGKKSCLTQERVELLDQLGFSWEVRPAVEQPRVAWHQRYEELKEFNQSNNHFLIPAETHQKLHLWSHEQRTRLKNLDTAVKDASRRMGPERVEALAELGFTKNTPLAELQEIDDSYQPLLEQQVSVEAASAAADHDAATLIIAVNEAVEAAVDEGMDAATADEAADATILETEAV